MTERKKASVARHAGSPEPTAPDPEAKSDLELLTKPRHFQGVVSWVIYIACWIVASAAVVLFIDALERVTYRDDE